MRLDINYDPDAEAVELVFDDYKVIKAQKQTNGELKFSRGMHELDEEVQVALKKITTLLMEIS